MMKVKKPELKALWMRMPVMKTQMKKLSVE
jgi:hypothetical protein